MNCTIGRQEMRNGHRSVNELMLLEESYMLLWHDKTVMPLTD